MSWTKPHIAEIHIEVTSTLSFCATTFTGDVTPLAL